MIAVVRSVRHFRSALRLQTLSYSSNFVRKKQLTNMNSGFAYKLKASADIHGFRNPTFMISRALSADAADAVKVTNGGYFLFFISTCVLTEISNIEQLRT